MAKKSFKITLLAFAVSAAGCSGAENSSTGATGAKENGGAKLAYILEKTATPTKWDTAGAEVVNFKHCVQRPSGSEAMIKATYRLHLDAIKFDLETIADAKANNYKVSSPPVKTHSASLIGACPSGAIATCDQGNVIDHYYTSAEWVLEKFEKSCGYGGGNTWTKNS